jgi:hypothetical protein
MSIPLHNGANDWERGVPSFEERVKAEIAHMSTSVKIYKATKDAHVVQLVTQGRNLRIVHDRVRKLFREYGITRPTRIGIDAENPRMLVVLFPDGSTCRHEFASATVLREYVGDRIRLGRAKFAPLEGWKGNGDG